MSKRHKHADVIHAWAEGETIQYLGGDHWFDYTDDHTPAFRNCSHWRIKPKIVKKEGWVNVYEPLQWSMGKGRLGDIWETKELADEDATPNRKACIRIEWEETE